MSELAALSALLPRRILLPLRAFAEELFPILLQEAVDQQQKLAVRERHSDETTL